MNDDPARARFAVIQLLRIAGVALVVFALLVIAGRFALPRAAGYVALGFGLVDVFVVPLLLARHWKSPDA